MVSISEATAIFKRRFAEAVKESGKNQKEIAQGMGISEQAVSRYMSENNEQLPRLDMLMRMSEYFGKSIDYFAGRTECATPGNEVIHKKLGLSDEAINTLVKLRETSPVYLDPAIVGINNLLESLEGLPIARHIAAFIGADFEEACPDMKTDQPPISYVMFHLGKGDDRNEMFIPFHVSSLADALIFSIGESLRRIREKKNGYRERSTAIHRGLVFDLYPKASREAEKDVNQEDPE